MTRCGNVWALKPTKKLGPELTLEKLHLKPGSCIWHGAVPSAHKTRESVVSILLGELPDRLTLMKSSA